MIVVNDTTPLRYLVVLGHLEILPRLFGSVHCPEAVIRKCRHPRAPAALREWAEAPPVWLTVGPVVDIEPDLAAAIDEGEAAAITLAQRLQAWVICMMAVAWHGRAVSPGGKTDHSRPSRHPRLTRPPFHR